jgi:hypothetical protein
MFGLAECIARARNAGDVLRMVAAGAGIKHHRVLGTTSFFPRA